jgi:hypothetical protein
VGGGGSGKAKRGRSERGFGEGDECEPGGFSERKSRGRGVVGDAVGGATSKQSQTQLFSSVNLFLVHGMKVPRVPGSGVGYIWRTAAPRRARAVRPWSSTTRISSGLCRTGMLGRSSNLGTAHRSLYRLCWAVSLSSFRTGLV